MSDGAVVAADSKRAASNAQHSYSVMASNRRLGALANHVAAESIRQPEWTTVLDQATQLTGTIKREARIESVEVCCIGAGISGLVACVELADAGIDSCLLIEKGADIGGTWHWNKYPGAACDGVPSETRAAIARWSVWPCGPPLSPSP